MTIAFCMYFVHTEVPHKHELMIHNHSGSPLRCSDGRKGGGGGGERRCGVGWVHFTFGLTVPFPPDIVWSGQTAI